jgi:trehalose/maltose hydrolase-like predicted phosphorylase
MVLLLAGLDEYANHIDAGGFTMPMISETLEYASSTSSTIVR